jgi:hypothetical protein
LAGVLHFFLLKNEDTVTLTRAAVVLRFFYYLEQSGNGKSHLAWLASCAVFTPLNNVGTVTHT